MAERFALGEQHSQQSSTAFEQHALQIDVRTAEKATVRYMK